MELSLNIAPSIRFLPGMTFLRIERWLLATLNPGDRSRLLTREAEFIGFIERNGAVIERICRSFSRKEDDYKDLRQDVLANIWTGLSEYRKESAEATWVYRITLNTCVSVYRRRPKDVVFVEQDKAGNVAGAAGNSFDSIQRINLLLKTLSVEDHSMMVMWLDDIPYEEIAEVMGMNKNTVATRLRRARLKLKELIESNKY